MRSIRLLLVLVLACTPADPQQLLILSKGGPPVRVFINGAQVVTVECGGGVVVRPGHDGAPPLPWDMTIIDRDTRRVLLDQRIAELPRWLVIFRDSAGVSASPISGPFVPCPAP